MTDRKGNPSDPAEEDDRVRKAMDNLEKWHRKYGGDLSGGVRMSVGNGPAYDVQIGSPEIVQKIVSRPIAPSVERQQIESAESAPEPPPIQVALGRPTIEQSSPPQFWLWRLINRVTGARS